MKVYLAARFSRLPELLDHKLQIECLAPITVTSRWLLGGHEWVGTPDEEIPVKHQGEFAQIDLDDINAADVVVCFTEPTRTVFNRGGRHVEMGYALAMGKPILSVGYRENVFYCLPDVQFVETWEEAKTWLLAYADMEGEAAA